MKKIKTLFKRQFENHKIAKCLNEVEPDCKWVLEGEGFATEKIDGTCCLIQDGKIYRRYDYKKGRKLPQGAIPCQEKADPITGHFPHWLLCTVDDPNSKYQIEAFERQKNENLVIGKDRKTITCHIQNIYIAIIFKRKGLKMKDERIKKLAYNLLD